MNFLTTLELSTEEREYLSNTLNVTQEEITAIENGDYSVISDITRLILILFTCTRHEEAWNNIRANLDKIDYNAIFTSPFVQLDRLATDVYKYMHDNKIIDDESYRYFEVLSGSLNDWDFWKSKLDGKTVEEKLRFLNESYNGVLGVNPYELGLVTLTKEQTDYIFGDLEKGEKIDFIFNEAPCVNVDPQLMQLLLFNDNLQQNLAGRYFSILFSMIIALNDVTDVECEETLDAFFSSINAYVEDHPTVTVEDILIDMNFKDIDHLVYAVKYFNNLYNTEQKYCSSMEVLINNPLMLMFSNTILERVYGKNDYINPNNRIPVWKYLRPSNYALAVSYKLNPIFDMCGFVIKNPFPGKFPIVYNYYNSILFFNGKIYRDYNTITDPENLFGFINNYLIGKSIDDDLFKNFNSEEEYNEFVLVTKDFRERANQNVSLESVE